MVRDIIKSCKQKAREEGTADLPINFGDLLLSEAQQGIPSSLSFVEKARQEGARDEDIAEWWNMPDLSRRMVRWSEQGFRFASFQFYMDQGLSSYEAMRKVRQTFPMYGDPIDTTHTSGDDRPLPNEIRGRVDKYRNKHDATAIREWSAKYNTYNAFVRVEMRGGRL